MTFAIHKGVWPVMITPWKEDNTPDFKALEALTNWYVEKGCDGIFAVCQSSEMHYLSAQEKLDIARCVSEAAAGRLQIVASGNTECSRAEQYRQIEDMMKIPGIGAYVLVSNRMDIKNEGEEAFRKNVDDVLAAFPEISFGIYECPMPWKRLLTLDFIRDYAPGGRLVFIKDTCCSAPLIAERTGDGHRMGTWVGGHIEPLNHTKMIHDVWMQFAPYMMVDESGKRFCDEHIPWFRINNLMRDMLALKAIESVGQNLATACQDGQNVQAREKVAYGSSMSGMVMSVDNLCSEHSLEHPLSAYHHEIAHGAGLIMISKAYYTHFVENCPDLHDRFIDMAKAMGKTDAKEPMDFVTALVDLQKACGVDELKMSDYGITPEEFPKFVENARSTMGILFKMDRIKLSDEDLIKIYTESYR